MRSSMFKGLCFGLTSGIITTLGMIVGLHSFSGSRFVILGGILTIAIADSFSDALGIHISEESANRSASQVWSSTISTFFSKLVFSLTFVAPMLFLDLGTALAVSIIWGMLALGILSYFIAKDNKEHAGKVVFEHLSIALIVIVLTHYLGDLISLVFGSL